MQDSSHAARTGERFCLYVLKVLLFILIIYEMNN